MYDSDCKANGHIYQTYLTEVGTKSPTPTLMMALTLLSESDPKTLGDSYLKSERKRSWRVQDFRCLVSVCHQLITG